MKYKILYTAFAQKGQSQEDVALIEADSDPDACEKYQKFKDEGRNSTGLYFWTFIPHGLLRIDQEEITTKIL